MCVCMAYTCRNVRAHRVRESTYISIYETYTYLHSRMI